MATVQLEMVPTLSKPFPATALAMSYRGDHALSFSRDGVSFGSLDWLGIPYGAQAAFRLKAVLPQRPEGWDYRNNPPLVSFVGPVSGSRSPWLPSMVTPLGSRTPVHRLDSVLSLPQRWAS